MSTQVPAGVTFEEPDGVTFEDPPAKKQAGVLDALLSYVLGNRGEGGAVSMVTAPFKALGAAPGIGRSKPEESGALEEVIKLLAPESNLAPGLTRTAAQTAVGLGEEAKAAFPLTAAAPPILQPAMPAADLLQQVFAQLKDLGGAALTAGGADFTPTEGMRMSRALKEGDTRKFMAELGATVPALLSLGLTGETSAIGRRLGLGAKAIGAPAGAGAGGTIPARMTTSATSNVLNRNVFGGGPPARTMPVPELLMPMSVGEASGSRAAQIVERAVEPSLFGSEPFAQLRTAQEAAVQDYGTKVGRYISKDIETAGGSNVAVTQRVKARMTEALDVLKTKANDLYNQVWSHSSLNTAKGEPRKFPLTNTPLFEKAEELIPRLEELVSRTGQESSLLNTLKAVTDPGKKWITLQGIQDIKQAMFNKSETAKLGISSSTATDLSVAADNTIRDILRGQGGSGLVARWEAAKRRYTEWYRTSEDAFVRKVLETNKDNAAELVKAAGLEDTDTIWKMLKPGDRQAVKARVLQDAIDAAQQDPISGFRRTLMRVAGTGESAQPIEQTLNASKLRRGVKDIGGEKLAKLYTPDELSAINTFVDAAERVGKGNWKNVTGLLLNGMLYHYAWRASAGDMSALAGALSVAGGSRLLGKMMADPGALKSMTSFFTALENAGAQGLNTPGVAFAAQRMGQEAARVNKSASKKEEEEQ